MAKKINTEQTFEQYHEALQKLIAAIEADDTPLEKLPKLIADANTILTQLQITLREINTEINK